MTTQQCVRCGVELHGESFTTIHYSVDGTEWGHWAVCDEHVLFDQDADPLDPNLAQEGFDLLDGFLSGDDDG